MSDFDTQQIDRSYLDPATKADAIRYLERTGNADMLVPLGLAADPEAKLRTRISPGACKVCDKKLPLQGVCRRTEECREAARERGEYA